MDNQPSKPEAPALKTPWEETRDGRLFLAQRNLDKEIMKKYKREFDARQAAKKTCCGRCKECG